MISRSLHGLALLFFTVGLHAAQVDTKAKRTPEGAFADAPPSVAISKKVKGKPPSSKGAPHSDDSGTAAAKDAGEDKAPKQNAYDFGLPTSDGKNLALGEYKGKILLVTNLGRNSSYNAQLAQLQKLNEAYKDKGLVVIGVPSNDFGNAEPGTPAEVAHFYADQKLTFPVMQVSTLTGVHELPFFTYLSKSKTVENDGLHWNYTKFLVDRKGNVVVCFPPDVAPDSLQMKATLEQLLDGTWKPKKPAQKDAAPEEDDDDD